MAIVRWSDPIREFAQLQDRINRAFSDAYGRSDEGLVTSGAWVPPVDIYQNGNQEIVLKAELPDMTREDIDVTVDKNTLSIKGEIGQQLGYIVAGSAAIGNLFLLIAVGWMYSHKPETFRFFRFITRGRFRPPPEDDYTS